VDPFYSNMPMGQLRQLAISGDRQAQQAWDELQSEFRRMDAERVATETAHHQELEKLQDAAAKLALRKDRREKAMLAMTGIACLAAVIAVVIAILSG
jgi:ferric-dicitrate binding protein FerR (iron transport regulator)